MFVTKKKFDNTIAVLEANNAYLMDAIRRLRERDDAIVEELHLVEDHLGVKATTIGRVLKKK